MPRSRWLREPVAHLQNIAFLLGPHCQKQLLQFGDHRPLQLQVCIAPGQSSRTGSVFFGPGMALEGATGIDTTDVDTAQKRSLAIHDQQLAVVALVHLPALAQRERIDRVELQHLNAAVLHLYKQRAGCEQRAHAVANQVDLHACALFGNEGIGKTLANFIVVKDVGFHVDVVARAFDGGQHGTVGFGAIAQQAHAVAGGQRAAGHRLFHGQMALEGIAVGRALGKPCQHRPALRRAQRAVRTQQLGRSRWARHQVGHQPGQAAAAAGQSQCASQGQQPAVHPLGPARAARHCAGFSFQGL